MYEHAASLIALVAAVAALVAPLLHTGRRTNCVYSIVPSLLIPPDTVARVTRKLGVTAGGESEEDQPGGEATVGLHCPVAGAHWVAVGRPNGGGSW